MIQEKGLVFWFTGLPGSGKTTLVNNISQVLRNERKVEILDGDELRTWLSPDVGYSRNDREKHILRVIKISEVLSRNGIIVLVALVSPYRDIRKKARNLIGESFREVFVKCSLETCTKRDPKGNYEKARRGDIMNMTGIHDIYEEPLEADIIIDTEKYEMSKALEIMLEYIGSQLASKS